jgi:hypothetical protein
MSAHAQLEEQIAAVFDLEEFEHVEAWAKDTIYIPFGERKGFLDLSETPWAIEPVASLVDPYVRTEAGVYGTQMSKTTQATVVALAAVAKLRQHFAWMWPKEAAARKFSKTRFQQIINASPELRALKPDNLDLFTNLELHFRNGGLGLFVGSHSAVDQKSSSVPLVIVDEIEDIAAATEKDADPITLINERSKTFADRKLFLFGSCLLENGPAWQQYLLGDQRHYLVPCPDCGTRQALEFRGPVWTINRKTGEMEQRGRAGDFRLWWDPAARQGEHEWDYEAVRATACYTCPECNAQIRDEHKRAMLSSAAWHPTTRAKIYGQRSRRIGSLYPMLAATSFPNFAIEFLGSRVSSKKLQNFTNNWESKPWSTGLDLADKTALEKRLGYLITAAAQGERAGARSLIIADVQRTDLVWALLHFDDAGDEHVVDCGYCRDFEHLRELDDERKPDFVAVDSRYRAQEVYDAVHTRRNRWIAIRGEKTGSPLSPNVNFDPYTGDRAGRQGMFTITLLHLNTYSWGEDFLNRLYPAKQETATLPGATPGATATGLDQVTGFDAEAPRIRDFHVFATFGKLHDFVKQLFSDYIVDYIDAKGRHQRKWHESSNNHLFDICKYGYAVGSFLGFTRIAIEARRKVEAAQAAIAAEKAKQKELPLSQPSGGTALFR